MVNNMWGKGKEEIGERTVGGTRLGSVFQYREARDDIAESGVDIWEMVG